MQSDHNIERPAATNGAVENRLVEPEFEIVRRAVRVVVFRESRLPTERLAVGIMRRDAPLGLFPAEMSDFTFAPSELSDVVFTVEIARSSVERLGTNSLGR